MIQGRLGPISMEDCNYAPAYFTSRRSNKWSDLGAWMVTLSSGGATRLPKIAENSRRSMVFLCVNSSKWQWHAMATCPLSRLDLSLYSPWQRGGGPAACEVSFFNLPCGFTIRLRSFISWFLNGKKMSCESASFYETHVALRSVTLQFDTSTGDNAVHVGTLKVGETSMQKHQCILGPSWNRMDLEGMGSPASIHQLRENNLSGHGEYQEQERAREYRNCCYNLQLILITYYIIYIMIRYD